MKRLIPSLLSAVLVAVLIGGYIVLSGMGGAPTATKGEDHKVWVCHADSGLGELKNGYSLIEVDVASTQYQAHQAHATTDPKDNVFFGLLYDYIDVDPNNLPGKCGTPTTTTTPPEPTTTVVETTTTVVETTIPTTTTPTASAPGLIVTRSLPCIEEGATSWDVVFTVRPDEVRGLDWSLVLPEAQGSRPDSEPFTVTIQVTPDELGFVLFQARWSDDVESSIFEQSRNIGQPELCETPPNPTPPPTPQPPTDLAFGFLGPVCVSDIPYIGWDLQWDGPETTADITVTLADGQSFSFPDSPLSGEVLWPGASVNPPDWPGWKLENGVWVEDPSDAILREPLTITAEVNPTVTGTIEYPPATSECANPPTSTPPKNPPKKNPPKKVPPTTKVPPTLPETR
jgi:hypothetical protein